MSLLCLSPLSADRLNRPWTLAPDAYLTSVDSLQTLVVSALPTLPALHTSPHIARLYKMCVMQSQSIEINAYISL
jgi:hypothetical protein